MGPAAEQGYSPDASVTPDEVGGGRPKPFMCYRNAILLGVYPLWQCVKIGDTPSDIGEGLNAGMWTIGITTTGNETGLSLEEWSALGTEERELLDVVAPALVDGEVEHGVAAAREAVLADDRAGAADVGRKPDAIAAFAAD